MSFYCIKFLKFIQKITMLTQNAKLVKSNFYSVVMIEVLKLCNY